MKYKKWYYWTGKVCRTPHGVRGLKFVVPLIKKASSGSHPAWGAWIEICCKMSVAEGSIVAPRMGCVD